MSQAASPRPPLGRPFTMLWAGQTASLVGNDVSAAGVSIAAYVQTGSVWWLSVLYLAVRIPALLTAAHAGHLVDRSDRRRVLLVADAAAGVTTVAALGLLLLGHLELWHLVVVAVVGSTANGYQQPAYLSALPVLVSQDAIGRANGMLQLSPALGLLAGPALAGLLLGLGDIGAVLAFDAATFVLAAVITAVVRIPPVASVDDPRPDLEIRGLRAMWRSLDGRLRGLRHLLVYAGALNLVISVVNVLLFALIVPLAGETGAGLLLSVGGCAMLVTAAVVSTRGVPPRRVRTVALGVAAVGIGAVVCGLQPSVVLVGIGLVVVLSGAAVLTAAAGTIYQTEVPAELQGRLAALRRVTAEALAPVAVLAIAPVAERLAEPAMQTGGALAATVGIVLGTGPGRGVALLFVGVGVVVIGLAVSIARDRTLAGLDRRQPEVPAAPSPVVAIG